MAEKQTEMVTEHDRGLLKRAKFLSAQVWSIGWKLILVYAIYAGKSDAVLMSLVGAAGVVESAFLGVQGWTDRYSEAAKAQLAQNGKSSAAAKDGA